MAARPTYPIVLSLWIGPRSTDAYILSLSMNQIKDDNFHELSYVVIYGY